MELGPEGQTFHQALPCRALYCERDSTHARVWRGKMERIRGMRGELALGISSQSFRLRMAEAKGLLAEVVGKTTYD